MGPVWVYWAFAMERFCGKMARNIKSRRFPYRNLDNRILAAAQLDILSHTHNLEALLNPKEPEDKGVMVDNPICEPFLFGWCSS